MRFFQDYVLELPRGVPQGLAALSIPVSIVWGDQDPYCPPSVAEDLARIMPGAELRWLEGADHFIAEERPANVLAAIGAELAR